MTSLSFKMILRMTQRSLNLLGWSETSFGFFPNILWMLGTFDHLQRRGFGLGTMLALAAGILKQVRHAVEGRGERSAYSGGLLSSELPRAGLDSSWEGS